MSRHTSFRVVLSALVLAVVAMPAPTPAQTETLLYGRMGVEAPERTDAGDWYGTWYHANRTRRMVLWFREKDGRPEVKMALRDKGAGRQSFTTDWSSKADYNLAGQHGLFDLDIETRDANTITGHWSWQIRSSDGKRDEAAHFTMYRAGWGRQLVVVFADLEQVSKHGAVQRFPELVWTFRKASRREVEWDELPF